ncbi:MAG TPA: hypothetical protein VFV00_19620 [Acidimicrobiales bacterium]|nr:hypothetical protein [Acidimicrobiales bacterium]
MDEVQAAAALVERRRVKRLGVALPTVLGLDLAYVAGSTVGQGAAVTLFIALTAVTGFADSQGFVHASRIWDEGRWVWREAWFSGAAFAVGVVSYWVVVRFIAELGVRSAAVQTMGWFAVTIAAVALTEGGHKWEPLDIATAIVVAAGLALLLYRTSA